MKIRAGGKAFYVKDCRGLSCIKGLMFDGMECIDGALVRGDSMWMPFVKRRLDLLFLDKGMRIITSKKAIPMTLNPATWKTYSCEGAKYCLEMKEGLCKAKPGTTIIIIRR